MTLPNVSRTPRLWNDDEIAEHAKIALNEFVDRRLAEPSGLYISHVRAYRRTFTRLFKVLGPFDPKAPDAAILRTVMLDAELLAALRYVAGPPVSEDDLGVLVTRTPRKIRKTELKGSPDLANEVLALICRLADPYRFPWLSAGRNPTRAQIRRAIAASITLHAAQAMATERRAHGRKVEKRLEARLIELGFVKTTKPSGGKINDPIAYPEYPRFYDECMLHGRKIDLLVALPNRRIVAIESKDSSSALNSIKRVLNDTAAKAEHFAKHGGRNIITVALLSGVFEPDTLRGAQAVGLYLVWAHDLDGFVEWIKLQD